MLPSKVLHCWKVYDVLLLPLVCRAAVTPAQGSHYFYEGVKLAQGRENVLRHLKDNPDTAARMITAVKAQMQEERASGVKSSTKKAALSLADLDDEDFEDELLDDDFLAKDLEDHISRVDASG